MVRGRDPGRGRPVMLLICSVIAATCLCGAAAGATAPDDSAARLAPEPIAIDTSDARTDASRPALPSETLEGQALRERRSLSLARTLETLAGVHPGSTIDPLATVWVRGMGGTRVVVLDNGFPITDGSGSEHAAPFVDPRLAGRIEVTRGPASLLHGSGALGGVVNVLPAELPAAEAGSAFARASGEASAGTGRRDVGGVLAVEGASGGLGWRASGAGSRAGNLSTPAGELAHLGLDGWSGEAACRLRTPDGSVAVRYVRSGGKFDLPLGSVPPGEAGIRRALDDRRLQLLGHCLVGGYRLELRGQWQRRSVEESGEGARLAGEGAGRGFGRLLNVYALDLRGSRRLSRLEITAGATGCTETSESRGPVPIVPDARLVSGAVLGLGRFATESWTLVGGARLDLSHLEALHNPLLALASQSRRFHAWSGNAGAVYQAPGSPFALGVHLGHAWRVPTLLELYAHGPRPGAERYELGRRDLQPERGLGLQAGLSFRMSRARAELTVFRDRIHDWIELTATDESRDSLPIYRYRAQGAALVGGEATLDLEATRSLRLRGRLDHVSGQHLEPRGPLSSIPPTHWGLEAELHHASLPGGLSALVRGELEGCARQNRLGPLDAPADGYMLLHLGYEVRRAAAGGTIRLGLRLDNVANTRYRDFLSRDPVLGPGPGRSLVARISSGS